MARSAFRPRLALRALLVAPAAWVALVAFPGRARADLSAYASGVAGYDGARTVRDALRSADLPTGPAYGVAAGAHLGLFDGYFQSTWFGESGPLTRFVAGAHLTLRLWRVDLVGRAGGGVAIAKLSLAPGTPTESQHGVIARAGGQIDVHILPIFSIGVSADAESFLMYVPESGAPGSPTSRQIGTDFAALATLTVRMGL